MYLKRVLVIFLIAYTMLIFPGCDANKTVEPAKKLTEIPVQTTLEVSTDPTPATREPTKNSVVLKNLKIVKIDLLDAKGSVLFTTANQSIIFDIITMLERTKPFTNENAFYKDLGDRDYRLIMNTSDGSVRELNYFYDYIKQTGYVIIDGNKVEPSFDFFSYMDNLVSQKDLNTNIPKDVQDLFEKYNWTVDILVNTIEKKLPQNLVHDIDEYPVKLYWAYNNELSKSIGYDISSYLGKNVNIEIYQLRESLPQYMWPRQGARGIILRFEGKIVVAYIDAGRHSSFACSLDRKRIEDITGKTWYIWVDGYINLDNLLKKRLSNMKPEEIVKEYYDALNKHDTKTAWSCLTRRNACSLLSMNMDNSQLYNTEGKDIRVDGNIISAVLMDIKEWKMPVPSQYLNRDAIEYVVNVDMKFEIQDTRNNGIQPWFVILIKESEHLGWKIDSIGSGP